MVTLTVLIVSEFAHAKMTPTNAKMTPINNWKTCHSFSDIEEIKSGYFPLRIHSRLSTILKTSNKSVWSNIFWYVKVSIFWKCIQCTIHRAKTQVLKKFPSDKKTVRKMLSFFFRELQLITVLLLICDSSMSWNTRFVCVRDFPFSIPFRFY